MSETWLQLGGCTGLSLGQSCSGSRFGDGGNTHPETRTLLVAMSQLYLHSLEVSMRVAIPENPTFIPSQL